jgi:hypothetical protein
MPEELDYDRSTEASQSRQVREPLCAARKKAMNEEHVGSLCAVGLVVEPGLVSLPTRWLCHNGPSVA